MAEAEARPPFGGLADQSASVKEQVKQQAANKARQLADQATSAADAGKDQIADRVGHVAQAFRRTGDSLREEDQGGLSQVTDMIGDQIERFAGYLQGRDVRGMTHELQNFARRQPALFIGGAFTLGLIAARFLKSSASHPVELTDDDIEDLPTAEYGTVDRGYGYGSQAQYGSQGQYGSPLGGQYGGSSQQASTPGYENPASPDVTSSVDRSFEEGRG